VAKKTNVYSLAMKYIYKYILLLKMGGGESAGPSNLANCIIIRLIRVI